MKLFLSWSGEVSHKVAGALRDWLPYIIQPVKPFLSSVDISKGERWKDVLLQELKDAKYGILCVTAYNVAKPWMNFEAGMLSNFFDRSCLTPLLFRIERSAITGPLAQFQSAICNDDDMFNMISSINYRLGDDGLDHELLRRTFDVWWKELKKELDQIPLTSQTESRTPYNWLYLAEDLTLHESNAAKVIWIITENPFKFALSDDTKQSVTENLAKGVRYRFFFRDSDEITDGEKANLQLMAVASKDLMQYKFVDKERFDRYVASDYVIINPEANSESDAGFPRRMFLRLPIRSDGFWIEVDDRSTLNFIDRFRSLWGPSDAPKQ